MIYLARRVAQIHEWSWREMTWMRGPRTYKEVGAFFGATAVVGLEVGVPVTFLTLAIFWLSA